MLGNLISIFRGSRGTSSHDAAVYTVLADTETRLRRIDSTAEEAGSLGSLTTDDKDAKPDTSLAKLEVTISEFELSDPEVVHKEPWTSRSLLRALFLCLLPSFLHPTTDKAIKKRHATSWLDGMRGVAALLVVIHHSTLLLFPLDIHMGWTPGDKFPATPLRLPIIRLLISGAPQVALFFVISGFSISHKPIRLLRTGRFGEASAAIGSSIFRRHTRLFLPAAVITFCTAMLRQLCVDTPEKVGFPGAAAPPRVPPIFPTVLEQLLFYGRAELNATMPFRTGFPQPGDQDSFDHPYNGALWTLPIEFSSSIVVFGFLLAFMHIRSRLRLASAVVLAVFVQLYWTFWALFLFFGGMIICELHFELGGGAQTPPIGPDRTKESDSDTTLPKWAEADARPSSCVRSCISLASRSRIVTFLLAAIGLWLLSAPERGWEGKTALGYATLYALIPESYGDSMLVPLGAIMLVLAVDRAGPSSWLQCVFSTRLALYLGRISFALYLVHSTMLWSLGHKLLVWSMGVVGVDQSVVKRAGPGGVAGIEVAGGGKGADPAGEEGLIVNTHGYFWAAMLAMALWWPMVIWVADVAARAVDERCVRFTHWVYGKMVVKES